MILKKKRCLPQSTESGQIGWASGFWFLLFLGVLLCACLQMEMFRASARYLEDALSASNLAAAVADAEEYGISHRLLIFPVEDAYVRYRRAVEGNLGLDEEWQCGNRSMISGPVCVERFTVYNVDGEEVEVCDVDGTGGISRYYDRLGSVTAPNGIVVEHTGVYSELSYRIKGLFGMEVEARKGNLAEVVKNEEKTDSWR